VYPAAVSAPVIGYPTRVQPQARPRTARRPASAALTPRAGRRIAIVIGSGIAVALVAVAAVSQGADAPPPQPGVASSPTAVSLKSTIAVGVEMASAALSPDGRTAATVGRDNTFLLWDLATGHRQGQFPTGNTRPISKVVFNRDGRIIATASDDATVDGASTAGDGVRLWSTSTRAQIAQPSTGHASDVAFSPDGSTVAIADNGVRLWDVAGGIQVGRLDAGDRMRAANLAFSANGVLAVGEVSAVPDTDEVRLWNVPARRQIGRVLVKKAILPPGLAFSADGRRLASVDLDGSTARVWDVAQNRQLGDAVGRKDLPFLVALSSDGSVLAVAGGDTVRLYDVASGQEIKNLYATENVRGSRFSGLAFSPNGRELVVCGRGVQIWDVAALTAARSGSPPTR
jgi:WD40 repeat protein